MPTRRPDAAPHRLRRPGPKGQACFLILTAAASAPAAHASWLDTDFYCRVYGCVVAHDGFSFDVYDNYDFATGKSIPPGAKMLSWHASPILGAGAVNPVITGTRTEGPQTAPLQDQGALLGIDRNGDGTADLRPTSGADAGFLDAQDALNPFTLTTTSDLVSAGTSAQRSFYLSSRTDFYLAARVFPVGPVDPLNTPSRFSNIGFQYQITRNGTDDGMSFGSDAQNGNGFYRILPGIDDLGDLASAPVNIIEFRQDIRQRNSASLPAQSIRFDYVYGFNNYDLSMGAGHLRYRIEFDFYNR